MTKPCMGWVGVLDHFRDGVECPDPAHDNLMGLIKTERKRCAELVKVYEAQCPCDQDECYCRYMSHIIDEIMQGDK